MGTKLSMRKARVSPFWPLVFSIRYAPVKITVLPINAVHSAMVRLLR